MGTIRASHCKSPSEVDEVAPAARYAEIMRSGLTAEQNCAAVACAKNLPLLWIEKVLMQRTERGTAQFATLSA